MTAKITTLTPDAIDMISQLSTKQKLRTVVEISSNIQVLQSAMRTLNAYKPDILDDGAAARSGAMARKMLQEVDQLNDKLGALTDALQTKQK
jgi:hypothetical protein